MAKKILNYLSKVNKLSVLGQIVKSEALWVIHVSVAAAQFCYCSMKAVIDNT